MGPTPMPERDGCVHPRSEAEVQRLVAAIHASAAPEHFSFMTLRVRTLAHEPGRRWLARAEACSLPLATRFVEELRCDPIADDQTRVTWHVAFEPLPFTGPGVALVAPRMGAWMQRCLDGLAEFHQRGPTT